MRDDPDTTPNDPNGRKLIDGKPDPAQLPAPDAGKPVMLESVKPAPLEPARPAWPEPPKPGGPGKEKPSEPKPRNPAPPTPHRRTWLWIALLILAAVALFLVFRACRSNSATAAKGKAGANGRGGQQAAAAIEEGKATTGNINIYVDALGTVTPVYTVTLYSQVTGQVLEVHYQEGQMVKKGDPLVDIDPRPYQSTLTQAEGALERDQGLLAQAVMDLKRYQAAWARNAIPRQQMEDQEKIVQQDQGTVKADQGTVDYDKVELSYCHIVSPITGRVGLRLVDPGNTVFSGNSSTLAVITQLQPITIVFNVSEDDLAQIQSQLQGGRTLEVDAYDRSNEKEIEAGKLTSLDNQVDTTTGTIKFRAEFPNKHLNLFPNQFVNARLLVKTLKNVVLIPTGAVQRNGTNAFVYVIQPDNTAVVQQITILTSNEKETAVTGLNAGTNVATSGFDRLDNNVAVTVTGNGSQPAQNNQGHGSNSGPGGSTTP